MRDAQPVLPRRALDLLDHAMASGQRVLVHGPPGFGCADVVRAWADRSGPGLLVHFLAGAHDVAPIPDAVQRIPGDVVVAVVEGLDEVPRIDGWLVLGPTSLLLEPAEIAALIDSVAVPGGEDAGLAEAVTEVTAGWPALVAAATEALGSPAAHAMRGAADFHAQLADHAARELLVRELMPLLPAAWQPVLEYLAIAGRPLGGKRGDAEFAAIAFKKDGVDYWAGE